MCYNSLFQEAFACVDAQGDSAAERGTESACHCSDVRPDPNPHAFTHTPAPRDNLDVKSDILDWHGDHIHTNFHGLFNALRDE